MHKTSGKRWGSRALAVAVVLAAQMAILVAAPSAFAGSDQIAYGNVGPGGAYGPRHSLTSVGAGGTGWTCVNALNADGSGWAGSSYCAPPGEYTSHPYCGCRLRYGHVYPYYYETIFINGYQYW